MGSHPGFAFFDFIPGNTVRQPGCLDSVSGKGIDRVLAEHLQCSYFLAGEAEMKVRIEHVILIPGESVQIGSDRIGSATVTPCMLNHPMIDFGYYIDCNGKSVFVTGNHEPPCNIYEPGDDKTTIIHEVVQGVGVFIADCSYTDAEYSAEIGWELGTFSSSMTGEWRTNIRVLFCTHHEPIGSDDALETAFDEALLRNAGGVQTMDIPAGSRGRLL